MRQENHARSLGEGHRIIYGVAGSGKTLILLTRARLLAQRDTNQKILVLCFNVMLRVYLKSSLEDLAQNINITHFDGWCRDEGIVRKPEEDDNSLGERFLNYLKLKGLKQKYDAILIDEAQDFASSWFECVLASMKEPETGDLLIVGDGNQSLYKGQRRTWSELGIRAVGRVSYKKFDLDKNYRNTREIAELALQFSNPVTVSNDNDHEQFQSPLIDPTQCVRSGPIPRLIQSLSIHEEAAVAEQLVQELISGRWGEQSILPVDPSRIAILTGPSSDKEKDVIWDLQNRLKLFGAIWLSNPFDLDERYRVMEPGVKIQTLQSSRGLQYQAVIILFTHLLSSWNSMEAESRRLFYIGITRAEDYLAILHSGQSSFIQKIKESDKALIESP